MQLLRLLVCSSILLACSHTGRAPQQLVIEPEQGRAPVLHLIQQARQEILIVDYLLLDEPIIHALQQAIKRGVLVKIMLERHPYQMENANNAAAQQIQASAIQLHQQLGEFHYLHQKTLVVDNQVALIMTFNLNPGSFKQTGERQRNFGILITEPSLIKQIKQVFEADWQGKPVHVTENELIWSPDNSRQRLMKIIMKAHYQLSVYAPELSDPGIIEALLNAHDRGVLVQILLATTYKVPYPLLKQLQSRGMLLRVAGNPNIHAKAIIVDGNTNAALAYVGSINFTENALDYNRELGIITQQLSIIQVLQRTFQHDWLQAYPLK